MIKYGFILLISFIESAKCLQINLASFKNINKKEFFYLIDGKTGKIKNNENFIGPKQEFLIFLEGFYDVFEVKFYRDPSDFVNSTEEAKIYQITKNNSEILCGSFKLKYFKSDELIISCINIFSTNKIKIKSEKINLSITEVEVYGVHYNEKTKLYLTKGCFKNLKTEEKKKIKFSSIEKCFQNCFPDFNFIAINFEFCNCVNELPFLILSNYGNCNKKCNNSQYYCGDDQNSYKVLREINLCLNDAFNDCDLSTSTCQYFQGTFHCKCKNDSNKQCFERLPSILPGIKKKKKQNLINPTFFISISFLIAFSFTMFIFILSLMKKNKPHKMAN